MRKPLMILLFLVAAYSTTLTGCVEVKPYQKAYLNDAEMEMAARKIEKSENSFQSYREGASGANGGKTGGGCGCN